MDLLRSRTATQTFSHREIQNLEVNRGTDLRRGVMRNAQVDDNFEQLIKLQEEVARLRFGSLRERLKPGIMQ